MLNCGNAFFACLHDLVELLEVLGAHEPVAVDALRLVAATGARELLGRVELLGLGDEDALEHVREVADVELVVEVRRRLAEALRDLLVHAERAP